MRLMEVILEDGKKIVITKNSPAEFVWLLNNLLDQNLISRVINY